MYGAWFLPQRREKLPRWWALSKTKAEEGWPYTLEMRRAQPLQRRHSQPHCLSHLVSISKDSKCVTKYLLGVQTGPMPQDQQWPPSQPANLMVRGVIQSHSHPVLSPSPLFSTSPMAQTCSVVAAVLSTSPTIQTLRKEQSFSAILLCPGRSCH